MSEIRLRLIQTEKTLLALEEQFPDTSCDDSRLVRAAHMLQAALRRVAERYEERTPLRRSVAA
jgi:hypothetical protein